MIKKVFTFIVSALMFGNLCMAKDSRTLVAYFSAEGHTKAVAEEIAKQTAADLFVIEPAKPYALNPYDDTELINQEAYNDMRPAVKQFLPQERVERYDTICSIAEAHGVTPAQVIIRWHLQEGLSVIPGATNHGYIKENIASQNFELSSDDMNKIRRIDKETCFFPHNYHNMKAVQENKVLPD